jgi:hypothetical protein
MMRILRTTVELPLLLLPQIAIEGRKERRRSNNTRFRVLDFRALGFKQMGVLGLGRDGWLSLYRRKMGPCEQLFARQNRFLMIDRVLPR